MSQYADKPKDELEKLLEKTKKDYQALSDKKLSLDMTRGKPSSLQLDLSAELLALPGKDAFKTASGTDCRNYGILDGIIEAKELFAPMLDVSPEEMLIGGNASLTLMHDAIWRAMTFGVPGGEGPWGKEEKVKFICPVPGYDRHFSVLENFGIEMIPVAMTDKGPDMAKVVELVSEDASIKGIFCVPKYSNPTGHIYSDEVVDSLASMVTKAPDFRIFWDNAYAVHFLFDKPDPLKPLLEACRAHGNEDRALCFGSTSKITFAGAGISFMAASQNNLMEAKKRIGMQTIGSDKINALRHTMFFNDQDGLLSHMKKHAALLEPKFSVIQSIFKEEFEGTGLLSWTNPKGGYFVSIDTLAGCAKRTVELAKNIGVKLTRAGATFPYGNDPKDRNMRLAPSLPPLEQVETAMRAVSTCVKLASLEKLLGVKAS